MNIGFFDIVFICNSQTSCAECEYKEMVLINSICVLMELFRVNYGDQ